MFEDVTYIRNSRPKGLQSGFMILLRLVDRSSISISGRFVQRGSPFMDGSNPATVFCKCIALPQSHGEVLLRPWRLQFRCTSFSPPR
ncbi:hypothetical protein DPEC_G00113820, partial [Dallia pectoralis]